MAAKITRLPQPASHTIEQVFDEFLGDQRRRLRPRTLSEVRGCAGPAEGPSERIRIPEPVDG